MELVLSIFSVLVFFFTVSFYDFIIIRANIKVKMGVSENPQEDIQEEAQSEKSGKVKILSTPTGYLRVRDEPSTLGQEVGRVEPEKTYDLLSTDEKTGWFKISFLPQGSEEKTEGWITNQYAQIVEPVPAKPSVTLSPKPAP